MKENRKLLREVLQDIRRDMTDEEVLNLLADSKISVGPDTEKSKYTLGQRAADAIAKFAGSWAFIFSFTGCFCRAETEPKATRKAILSTIDTPLKDLWFNRKGQN